MKKNFINVYKLLFCIDQTEADHFKNRNMYYHQEHEKSSKHSTKSGSCCGSFYSKIYIPEKERTILERKCAEITHKIYIKSNLENLMNNLSQSFENIKKGGIKDNLNWNSEAEQYILTEVLREGVHNFFLSNFRKEIQKEEKNFSKQPLLLATPSIWKEKHPEIDLKFLLGDTINDFHKV